jgi:hypothetical protein
MLPHRLKSLIERNSFPDLSSYIKLLGKVAKQVKIPVQILGAFKKSDCHWGVHSVRRWQPEDVEIPMAFKPESSDCSSLFCLWFS